MGVDNGIIRKSGSWFTYGDDQLGQGKENVRQFLVDNPELADEIEGRILTALGIGTAPEEGTPAEEPSGGAARVAAAAIDPSEDAGF